MVRDKLTSSVNEQLRLFNNAGDAVNFPNFNASLKILFYS